ncbi:LIM domain transcription factor LMO4 [Ctenodactylus gundi]
MVNPGSSSQPPPVTAGSLSWKRCAGCGGKIADRFLLYAMDSYWHSRCLKCSCCQAQLGDIGTSCYTKSGMILCRNDYIRLFGNSGACSACGQSIPASELVMRAQGNVYHLKCFTCSTCRNRLVPGDRFHYINGSLFCEHDRPTALINGHLNSLQSNPLLPDQKVNTQQLLISFIRVSWKVVSHQRWRLQCLGATCPRRPSLGLIKRWGLIMLSVDLGRGHSKCKDPEAGAMWLYFGDVKGGNYDCSKMSEGEHYRDESRKGVCYSPLSRGLSYTREEHEDLSEAIAYNTIVNLLNCETA